jgi:hypothetical protein
MHCAERTPDLEFTSLSNSRERAVGRLVATGRLQMHALPSSNKKLIAASSLHSCDSTKLARLACSFV